MTEPLSQFKEPKRHGNRNSSYRHLKHPNYRSWEVNNERHLVDDLGNVAYLLITAE